MYLNIFTSIPKTIYALRQTALISDVNCSEKNIQRYFLNYGIYVPFSDILVRYNYSRNPYKDEDRCSLLIPIEFQVPFIGVFVYSWKHKID